MEPVEKCQNCSKEFPQSKINSHFSYCRRNIKKCQLCKEMVDINYLEDHNQDFHTKQNCKHCRKPFDPQEFTKHQNTCSSRPVYCEFCQLDISVKEFDKHLTTCGSRTKLCAKCQKNVMLREYDVHSVSCRGKPVQPPPPPVTVPKEIQKKFQPEVRQVRQPQPITNITKPEVYSYKPDNPQVAPINSKYTGQVPSYNIPSNNNKVVSGGQSYFKQAEEKLQADFRGKEAKKQQKVEEKKQSYNIPQERIISDRNDRYQKPTTNPIINNQVTTNDRPPVRQPTTTTTTNNNQIRREPQRPNPIYQQRKQIITENQRQKPTKVVQSPLYQPPSYNPPQPVQSDIHGEGEDEQLQRAIYESMGINKKIQEFGGMDLGVDAMSQSFIRDLQLQDHIQNSVNSQKVQPPRRR